MNQEPDRVFDEYLVVLTQQGSRDAMDRLVHRWTPRLLRYVSRTMGSSQAARDIVQETWIGVIRGLKRLEDPSQFSAWVYRVAYRKCVDGIRANQRQRRLQESIEHDAAITVAGSPSGLGRRESADLSAAISQLSQEKREVVHLFYGEDLSIDDIATVLSVPAGTVKSRLHQARESLKHFLGD
jgi:RNA polymerase sigma factor (sigma-70 family)